MVGRFAKLTIANAAPSFIISSVLRRAKAGNIDSHDFKVLETLLEPLVRGKSEGNSPTRHGAELAREYVELPPPEGIPVVFSGELVDKVIDLAEKTATNLVPAPVQPLITAGIREIRNAGNPKMSDNERLHPHQSRSRGPRNPSSHIRVKNSRPLTSMGDPLPTKKVHTAIHPRKYEICNLKRGNTLFWSDLEKTTALADIRYHPHTDSSDDTVRDRYNRWYLHGDQCEICERCAKHIGLKDSGDYRMHGSLRDTIAMLHAYSYTEQSRNFDDWLGMVDFDEEISRISINYGLSTPWAEEL